ncbi:MAG: cadherin-like beta sandwich domain-containing protein [Candidatus Azobacteroides sp.]|nr:cadherin-like beta sandwich domain-containing protein [Candidatus Azobacteroides sp.]
MKNITKKMALGAMLVSWFIPATAEIIPVEPDITKSYWISDENGRYVTQTNRLHMSTVIQDAETQKFRFAQGEEHGGTPETSAYFLTTNDGMYAVTENNPSELRTDFNEQWHVIRLYQDTETGRYAFYFCGSAASTATSPGPRNNLGIRSDNQLGPYHGEGIPTAAECIFYLEEVTEKDQRILKLAIEQSEAVVNAVNATGEQNAIGTRTGQYPAENYARFTSILNSLKESLDIASDEELEGLAVSLTNARWDLFRSVVVPDGRYHIVYEDKYMTVPETLGTNQRPYFTAPVTTNLKSQVFVLTNNTGTSYKVEDTEGHFLNEKPFMMEDPNASSGGYSDQWNNVAFFFDITSGKYAARNAGPQADALKVGSWIAGDDDVLYVDNQNLFYDNDTKPYPAATAFFFTLQEIDCSLKSLTTPQGTLTPAFDPYILQYTLQVEKEVEYISLTAETNDPAASIRIMIHGETVADADHIALDYGENTITILVTAPEGIDSRMYTLTVTRAKNTDASLSALTISDGTLTPAFDTDIIEYTADVPYEVSLITIEAIATDQEYAVVEGAGEIELNTGENTVLIKVTAQDESTTQEYTLTINRALNNDASLLSLEISGGETKPAFSPDIFEYTVSVPYEITDFQFEAVAADGATIQPIEDTALTLGENTFEIVVTAEDGIATQTYPIHVIRNPNTDTTLRKLVISEGELSPAFSPVVFEYTVTVPYETTTFAVLTAIPTDEENATVEITGNSELTVGNNIFRITVTAADGVIVDTYTITVIRQNPAGLSAPSSEEVIIKSNNGMISAAFNGKAMVKLCSVTGLLIHQEKCTDTYTKQVPAGIYVLTINNKGYKVIVK